MARRLLRLANPHARLAFLKEHPFFADTSASLREKLGPQMVRRCSEQTKDLVEQGAEPADSTDYLFIIAPEAATKVEVLLDGKPIATICGSAVFGQEVVFGVAHTFVFGARVAQGSCRAVWVIPRKVIQSLLQKDAHMGDVPILQEHAREITATLLRNWYTQPTAPIRLRLFEHAEHAFKVRLVQSMIMAPQPPGAVIRRAGEDGQDSCLFIFRGKASVHIPGNRQAMMTLSHSPGTSAWAAWWGLLEVLGVCPQNSATVSCDTDCIVWYLSPLSLKVLRAQFPMESQLFDKVAREHAKLLQPSAPSIADAPLFRGCDAELLEALASSVQPQLFDAGARILCEGDPGEEVCFLARGRACTLKQHAERGAPGHPVPRRSLGCTPLLEKAVSTMPEGSIFGEATALGFSTERTATVLCETLCDVRVLTGSKVRELMGTFPCLAQRLLKLARLNGFVLRCEAQGRLSVDDLEVLRGLGLSDDGLLKLDVDMGRLVSVKAQVIAEQGGQCNKFFALVEGIVQLEIDNEVVGEIEAPAVLGQQALLRSGAVHRATLRSKGVCCLRVLPTERHTLERMSKEDKELLVKRVRASWLDLRVKFVYASEGRTAHSQPHHSLLTPTDMTQSRPASRGSDCSSITAAEEGAGNGEGSGQADWLSNKPTTAFLLTTFFKNSKQAFLEYLLMGMETVVYKDNEFLLREGDEGDFAILINTGFGVVEVGGVKVGEVKNGSFIGEAVLFGQGARRTATVRAVGTVSGCTLSRRVLLAAFEHFPEEKRRIEDLARLRGLTNKVLTAQKKSDLEETRAPSKPSRLLARRMTRYADAGALVFGSISRCSAPASRASFGRAPQQRREERATSLPAEAERRDERATNILVEAEVLQTEIEPQRERQQLSPCAQSSAGSYEGLALVGEDSEEGTATSRSQSRQRSTFGLQLPTEQALPGQGRRCSSSFGENPGEASLRCAEWACHRRRLIREAPLKRNQRLVKNGDMLPLVPAWQGYHLPQDSKAPSRKSAPYTSVVDRQQGTPPWSQRLRRAEGIYAPPVWHEIFGA